MQADSCRANADDPFARAGDQIQEQRGLNRRSGGRFHHVFHRDLLEEDFLRGVERIIRSQLGHRAKTRNDGSRT